MCSSDLDGRTAQAADRATSFLGFPISEPVIRVEENGRARWCALYGMTRDGFDAVLDLARAWSNAPALNLRNEAFAGGDFDRCERAFKLRALDDDGPLAFDVAATEGRPIRNLALVIEGWGDYDAALNVDGDAVPRGYSFRYAHRLRMTDTDLVVWIAHSGSTRTRVTLRRVQQD